MAQPQVYAWMGDDQVLRLVEQSVAKDDPDPKALSCYGLLVRQVDEPDQIWLRFVDGRPVSAITTQYLAWCSEKLAAAGKKVLVLTWDNASWHISREVRGWLREHNRRVKGEGQGVRIITCCLPIKSPWLNPIEAHWVHGKRKVAEPASLLSSQELADRVCAHFGCQHETHLAISEKAS